MAETPKNQTLGSKLAKAAAPAQPAGPAVSASYPSMRFHKDSKVGALLGKQVDSPEEAAALGPEWVTFAELGIETAPAAKE